MIKVPMKEHPTLGFRMPVKLDFTKRNARPMKRDGKRVYALPGGGEFLEEIKPNRRKNEATQN